MLPIWVGAAEAAAIAYAQQGVDPPRPLTHDLFATVLSTMGHRLEAVHITELRDNVFYAELHFEDGVIIESRPSDAIALALRVAAPVFGDDTLFEEVGVSVPEELASGSTSQVSVPEEELEAFKEFLDQVSADDFGTDVGSSEESGGDPPE